MLHRTARAARAARLPAAALAAVLVASLASAAGPSAPASADAPDGAAVHLVRDGAGRVRLLAADGAHPAVAGTPDEAARHHLDRVGHAFGVGAADLRTMSVTQVAGRDVVRFQQTVAGLPVLGGQLVTVLDAEGGLLSVSGETARRGSPAPAYDVAASTAERTALQAVAAGHHVRAATLRADRPTRWLLDRSLLEPGAAAGLRPVWRVPVRSAVRADLRDVVLVDAGSGRVALRLDQVAHLDRVVCDDVRTTKYRCAAGAYDRTEGAPPTGLVDADQAYDLTGATATWYAGTLGVDLTVLIGSDLGDGRKLRSTTNYCPPGACPLDNAFWAGDQMVYGAGYTAADDVVAHELTHGVTERTAGLVYWYQSGAINESMSDVMGELVDQADGVGNDAPEIRWRLGEDLPATLGGVTRSMADPPSFLQPDTTSSTLYDVAIDYDDNGAVHTNSGVPNKTAYLIADGTVAEPAGAFHGRAFPGIGTGRTAVLYWTTLQMLTPGADFLDLAAALRQACANLAFTAAECETVAAAVDATELGRWTGPSVPRNVSMTGGPGEVRLSWAPPLATGSAALGSYVVSVSPDVHGDDFSTLEPTATDFVLTGLAPGVDYTVRLMAVSSEGTSPAVTRTFAGRSLTAVAPASVLVGRPVRVTGTLRDAHGGALAGRRVQLVRRVPGVTAYAPVDVTKTRRDGSYAFDAWTARRRADWYVVYAGGGRELGVRSARRSTLVRQRVTLDRADLAVPTGRAFTLTGAVRPVRSGPVSLQRLGPDGAWVTVQRGFLDRDGRWALTWRVRSGRPTELRVRVGPRPAAGLAPGISRVLTLNP